MTEGTKWAAGINALLGLWLIAAPFVLSGAPQNALWNAVIVGIVIAGIGGYNWNLTNKGSEVSVGAAALNALLGLWMIAAPFVLGSTGTMKWNSVGVGVVVAILAGYNMYEAYQQGGQ